MWSGPQRCSRSHGAGTGRAGKHLAGSEGPGQELEEPQCLPETCQAPSAAVIGSWGVTGKSVSKCWRKTMGRVRESVTGRIFQKFDIFLHLKIPGDSYKYLYRMDSGIF